MATTAPMKSGDTAEQQKFTVTLPDWQDSDSVHAFLTQLAEHADVRGVKVLQARTATVLKHAAMLQRDITACQKAVNYINGTRSTAQSKGDSKRSLRYRAQQYFDSLGTTALRQQCELFGVDYDAYDTMEEIVTALVDKNVAMQGGSEATNGQHHC